MSRTGWLIPVLLPGLLLSGRWASPVQAQEAPAGPTRCDTSQVVDRVVAVVGEVGILGSQLDEELFTRAQQQRPESEAELRALCREILSDLVDAEVLVQMASRDTSIKVTDQEVADGVDQQFRNVRQRFKTELEFRGELRRSGFQTPEEFRRYLTDLQRKAAYRNRLLEKMRGDGHLKPVQPTEREMRAYFEQYREQLPQRPATIGFRNIVIPPRPAPEARDRARNLADSLVLELRGGADFATAAKRFSQDPGSREQGGDLGWFRRGQMVPEFDTVAFRLRPGAVSPPVESPFGFHIIQVQRVQPAEIQARHILIMSEVAQADADSATARAGEVARALRAGASFDSLARLYHDASEERETPDAVPVSKLPEEYRKGIGDADSGMVVGPFSIHVEQGLRRKMVIAVVTVRRPEGEIVYQDVKDQIRKRLADDLAVRRYIDRLRRATYVDIRL